MFSHEITAQPLLRPDHTTTALRGRRLVVARIVWGVLVGLALVLFGVAIPALYLQLSTPPALVRASVTQLGFSVGVYAAYLTALQVISAAGYLSVAAVIVWRKSADGMALFVSLSLVLLGTVSDPMAAALETLHPAFVVPARCALFLVIASLILFFFLFPDGQFVPRWTRAPLLIGNGVLLVTFVLTGRSDWSFLLMIGAFGGGVTAQIYRYLRVSGPVQRQQTKWVVFGATTALVGAAAIPVVETLVPSLTPPGIAATPYDVISVTGLTFVFLLIPMSISVAILRYRLWDIDIIINRTLVYSALTACVVGIYVLVVGYLGAVFRSNGNLIISLVATGLVAVFFQPLRERLQRGVNRLLYGLRDEPYVVLARLGQRLQATLNPDAVLSTIVATVREALKLSYAAIEVQDGSAFALAAASGSPPAHAALRLPLVHQGEPVGTLLIAPRGRDVTLTPADLRLLDDLTHQIGVAVHTVRLMSDLRALTGDLQRSREQLVLAREEERRRLRRDLHDDLAPTLAGLAFTASTARDLVATDPPAATALLGELHTGIRAVVGEIRRLVYDLRPPALDEFGLVAAVRERAAQYSDQARADAKTRLHVDVEAPERLPPLPAAVEVAAYRIVQEALMNVVRHAQARTCHIRIALTDGLQVAVLDDGVGVPEHYQPGVGLRSMRERTAELGGSCVVERRAPAGTQVIAWLPLRKEERDGPTAPADR